MTIHLETTLAVDEPLARAVLYRFAGELFSHPLQATRTWREWRAGLERALETCAETGTPPELVEQFRRCTDAGNDPRAVAGDYERVIGPTPRAGAVPYETEWLGAAGDLLQFHQIADLSAFYRAFGLKLADDAGERADHLGVELSFLHFLCVKESFAAERGERELAQVSRDAQRRFLDEHLARWAPAFCRRLAQWDPLGFFGRGATALGAWIEDECRRLGATAGDPTLAPGSSSITLEDLCVSCGKHSLAASEPAEERSGDGADRDHA